MRRAMTRFRIGQRLRILIVGDARLFNQYCVIPVNPQRHPPVKIAGDQRFFDWELSDAGLRAIAS